MPLSWMTLTCRSCVEPSLVGSTTSRCDRHGRDLATDPRSRATEHDLTAPKREDQLLPSSRIGDGQRKHAIRQRSDRCNGVGKRDEEVWVDQSIAWCRPGRQVAVI